MIFVKSRLSGLFGIQQVFFSAGVSSLIYARSQLGLPGYLCAGGAITVHSLWTITSLDAT
jgi:hypothetical protein